LSERWRKPLTVIDVYPSDSELILLPDGRVQRQNIVVYDRESTERIRQGWACVKCGEPFPQAWPEQCPVCGAPIRERQAEYFAKEYAVLEDNRPSLEEEIEGIRGRAEEEEERRKKL
jgi:hypothetical protein